MGAPIMKELDLQTLIIKVIKGEDGHGRKLSHRFLVGIPDLLLSLSLSNHPEDFELVLAEVKILKFSKAYDLRRSQPKLGVTPKQLQEMKSFKRAVTIVGIQRDKGLGCIYVMGRGVQNFPDSNDGIQFGIIKNGKCEPPLTSMILEILDGY
jgi:hypothetical protein